MQDLSRPRDGERNVVTLASGVRFAKVISRKFICPSCNTFCGELIPILDRKVRAWLKKTGKDLMTAPEVQVKVFCFAGCHHRMHWGFKEFDWEDKHDIHLIKEWPDEWKNEESIRRELAGREANEQFRKGGGR